MQTSAHCCDSKGNWDIAPPAEMDSANTLVLIFANTEPTPEVQQQLHQITVNFPRSVIMGCSTAGQIYGSGVEDETIVATVMRFEHTRLHLVQHIIDSSDTAEETGANIANKLPRTGLKAVFTLTDGLMVNGSDYTNGLANNLPEGVTVTGGLAGDGERFKKTWVMYGRKLQQGMAVACGFYGDAVHVRHASRAGWDRIGPKRKVTGANANILYSLDEQPALSLYKKYLGDRAKGLPATGLLYPLGMYNENAHEGVTVRTILSVNEADQSIVLAGNLPEGSSVRLMWASMEQLIQGAANAAEALDMNTFGANESGVCVAISCVGRRLVMQRHTRDELDAVMKNLPNGIELVGYYSYGEISPLVDGRCDLHNQSMTLTLFSEESPSET